MKNNKTLLKKLKSFTRKNQLVEHCSKLAEFVETLIPDLPIKEEHLENLVKLLRLEKNADEAEMAFLLNTVERMVSDFYSFAETGEEHMKVSSIDMLFTEVSAIMKPYIKNPIWKKYENLLSLDPEELVSAKELLSEDDRFMASILEKIAHKAIVVCEDEESNEEPDVRFHLQSECLDEEKEVIAEQIANMIHREFSNIDVEILTAA
ncbi:MULTISPECIES: hypothetical protein [unclassified Vibrio]|uniref:hypothetical protein n=1 Tax=unclassified Vibrio TaxID=2614977 RepID=UPI000C83FD6D|nr:MULTISPECIES: hypothetical protein [unclassified Vibrio]PMK74890.1 hypothetical protein BCT92_23890 [Vibrio sp. 10N.261.52.E5]TKF76170.1 hypothetical protein FCV65_24740 [Vibrio sp. F13]